MAGSLRRFFSNIICGFVPGKDRRRRLRVVLNSNMGAYLRFIRADLGYRPRRVRTFVGYLARSLLISVNDRYIYKFPLRRDDSDDLARREKRVLDALAPLSSIYIPSVKLLEYNGRIVRRYDYVPGVQFRKVSVEYAEKHMDKVANQIAQFIYEIGCANPLEIADLKPSVDAVPGYAYGWTQGDIYDNFLIDPKTHSVVAVIDWEDCYFGDFSHVFRRRSDSATSRLMVCVAKKYDALYNKDDKDR